MRGRFIAVVFVCCVTPAVGQTSAEFDREYGKPVDRYSVSRHISMTPDYAADGQVCRIRLYPKHNNSDPDDLSRQLKFDELKGVLNKLVPLERRGQKKDSFGLTDFGGGAAWTTYEYENVTFVFGFSLRLDPSVKEQPEPVSFPVDEVLARLPPKTPPSLNDFTPSESTKIEIATILWNNRNCAP